MLVVKIVLLEHYEHVREPTVKYAILIINFNFIAHSNLKNDGRCRIKQNLKKQINDIYDVIGLNCSYFL